MQIRVLTPDDATAYQSLRVTALRECPLELFSSYEEELKHSIDFVAQRITPTQDKATIGALIGGTLVGIVNLKREEKQKLSHKAILSGVYVAPTSRQQRVCYQLIDFTLSFASETLGVRQVNLGVTAKNSIAIKIYSSLGFTEFGIERDFMFVNGSFHDVVHMALIFNEKS